MKIKYNYKFTSDTKTQLFILLHVHQLFEQHIKAHFEA